MTSAGSGGEKDRLGCKVQRTRCPPLSFGLGLVTLHMQGQVIGAGEAALAHLAAEWLGSRVFSYVTRQFVRTSEAPLARGEVTAVRLFTCTHTKTRLHQLTAKDYRNVTLHHTVVKADKRSAIVVSLKNNFAAVAAVVSLTTKRNEACEGTSLCYLQNCSCI